MAKDEDNSGCRPSSDGRRSDPSDATRGGTAKSEGRSVRGPAAGQPASQKQLEQAQAPKSPDAFY